MKRACPGCDRELAGPRDLIACPPCWAMVPQELRAAVGRTVYTPAGKAARYQAIRACVEWLRNAKTKLEAAQPPPRHD